MNISEEQSKSNYNRFLWHAIFLSFVSSFIDIDTIIPSMLIQSGAGDIALGFLTAIMLGSSTFFQLFFATFLSTKKRKKKYLLIGIGLRVISLFGLSLLFINYEKLSAVLIVFFIFLLIFIFSVSGSFAGVSYTDIFGKSIIPSKRKGFFSIKQIIIGIGALISSFLAKEIMIRFNYPNNYALLFLLAGFLLFIASWGFMTLDEPVTELKEKKNILEIIKYIPKEIKKNKNLKYYLILINIMGFFMTTTPFLIKYAKNNFGLTGAQIGNYLILRVTGVVLIGFLLVKISKNYKFILKLAFIIAGIIPIAAILLKSHPELYQFIFIFIGMSVAMIKVVKQGVLLEISTNENRVIYTGITSSGNLVVAIFPIISGFLITAVGFEAIFISLSITLFLFFFLIDKLDCSN